MGLGDPQKLPRRLWEFGAIALGDLELAEREKKRFKIDMVSCYHKMIDGRLHICHSGAVMAFSLGASDEAILSPDDFPGYYNRRLRAIDRIGQGDIDHAFNIIYRAEYGATTTKDGEYAIRENNLHKVHVPDYATSPRDYKERFMDIIARLKELRL